MANETGNMLDLRYKLSDLLGFWEMAFFDGQFVVLTDTEYGNSVEVARGATEAEALEAAIARAQEVGR